MVQLGQKSVQLTCFEWVQHQKEKSGAKLFFTIILHRALTKVHLCKKILWLVAP